MKNPANRLVKSRRPKYGQTCSAFIGSLWRILTLICLVSLWPSTALRAETSQEQYGPTLIERGHLLDHTGTLTVDDFLLGRQVMPEGGITRSQGRSGGTLWLQAELPTHPQRAGYIIEIPYPHLREITLYWVQNQRIIATDHGGYAWKGDRSLRCQGSCFSVPAIGQEPLSAIIAIRSESPLIVPLHFYSPTEHQWHTRTSNMLLGLFYGAFVVMLFYNLFIYFSTRATEYILYVVYIASVCLWVASHDGTLRDFVLTPDSALSGYNVHVTLTMLGIIAGGVFSRAFLNTRQYAPRCDLILQTLIYTGVVCTLWTIISPQSFYVPLTNLLTLLMTGLAILCAIKVLLQGYLLARYFLLAWVSVVAATLFWVLTLSGYLPYFRMAGLYVHFGCLLETVLLSLALADRINQLQHKHNTLQRSVREQLEESNRKLSAANRFKDEFLSTVSHELRTPMNGVIGSADLLAHTALNEEQQSYLQNIHRSSHTMLRLVEDILTHTQLDDPSFSVESTPINLPQLFETLTTRYRIQAESKGLSFSSLMASNVPVKLSGDSIKLNIILNHILDNTCKFTEHGNIKLKITLAESAGDEVAVRFSVSDTGMGIAPEMQEKVFELFRQVDGSMTRKQGGLGIGLALCRRITQLMGGKLELISEPGKGTDIHLTLPFQPVCVDEIQPSPIASNQAKTKAETRILVVEDNQINRVVLEKILTKLGYQTLTANNGQDALRLLDTDAVDLILMDCQMPVMDGYEATRLIRNRQDEKGKLPIIAVTANASPADKQRCLESGMDDFIAKPFTQKDIATAVEYWLGRSISGSA